MVPFQLHSQPGPFFYKGIGFRLLQSREWLCNSPISGLRVLSSNACEAGCAMVCMSGQDYEAVWSQQAQRFCCQFRKQLPNHFQASAVSYCSKKQVACKLPVYIQGGQQAWCP